jgi:hypothetical protein
MKNLKLSPGIRKNLQKRKKGISEKEFLAMSWGIEQLDYYLRDESLQLSRIIRQLKL